MCSSYLVTVETFALPSLVMLELVIGNRTIWYNQRGVQDVSVIEIAQHYDMLRSHQKELAHQIENSMAGYGQYG